MQFNRLMRVLYLLIFILLPLLSLADAQEDVLLAKGNSLYTKGAYAQALETYQKILNKDQQSVVVYFNMGNASFKLGDLPSALLYYEKAHRLAPNDEDIKANIRFVNSKTVDKVEELPVFFLNSWWTSVILLFSLTIFAVLSLFFILVGSGLLILYFFSHELLLKKISFYAAIVLFVVGVFTVFVASQQQDYQAAHQEAIVFATPVTVKSAPSETSRSLFVLHEGAKVTLGEKNNGWSRIRLANGNEGWMKNADFREID